MDPLILLSDYILLTLRYWVLQIFCQKALRRGHTQSLKMYSDCQQNNENNHRTLPCLLIMLIFFKPSDHVQAVRCQVYGKSVIFLESKLKKWWGCSWISNNTNLFWYFKEFSCTFLHILVYYFVYFGNILKYLHFEDTNGHILENTTLSFYICKN